MVLQLKKKNASQVEILEEKMLAWRLLIIKTVTKKTNQQWWEVIWSSQKKLRRHVTKHNTHIWLKKNKIRNRWIHSTQGLKRTANLTINWKISISLIKFGKHIRCPPSQQIFNSVLEIASNAIWEEKKGDVHVRKAVICMICVCR